MSKQKNYLVYDGDDDGITTGSLREHFEKDEDLETAEEMPKPLDALKATEEKKKPIRKKTVEKILIGIIIVIVVLMIGTIGLLLSGERDTPIDIPNQTSGRISTNISNNPTARQIFSYISQNNQAIISYFSDVRETLVNNPEQLQTKLSGYRKEAVEDIDIFSSYRQIYTRYDGASLHDIYTERILNAFDLIKSVSEAESKEKAIEQANKFINKEKELNTRSIAALIV